MSCLIWMGLFFRVLKIRSSQGRLYRFFELKKSFVLDEGLFLGLGLSQYNNEKDKYIEN